MEEASDNNNNVGDTTDDESTCVAVQNQNQNQNQNDNPNSQPESDAVAKGISSTLGTVISDFDSRAQARTNSLPPSIVLPEVTFFWVMFALSNL
ncbi:hypothetical protein SO802_010549 [Lithocarpus litseifolius]|uniref:Uncharacterized protein n=1 Tax=Lithocarpus litseifolius TaxID=425828 RepID=A0AAW2DGS1_9ROSI